MTIHLFESDEEGGTKRKKATERTYFYIYANVRIFSVVSSKSVRLCVFFLSILYENVYLFHLIWLMTTCVQENDNLPEINIHFIVFNKAVPIDRYEISVVFCVCEIESGGCRLDWFLVSVCPRLECSL